MKIAQGQSYYIPAATLGITAYSPYQQYKIQIHKPPKDGAVLVVVKHYKTRKCNKVTLLLKVSTIEKHGIEVTC